MSRVALLVTGASGMRLPVHTLGVLARQPAVDRLHLVVSTGAARVLRHEMAGPEREPADALLAAAGLAEDALRKVRVHANHELDAEIASGSYRLDATMVVPCSSGSLGALASGNASTLIHRAGLVALKERWPLLLGFRETPLALTHVENMRRLTYAGAVIVPPVPAFYVGAAAGDGGETLERFLDAYVLRLMDLAGIAATAGDDLRWEGGSG